VYTFAELLNDLRHGVFTEIYAGGPVKIDVYRRGLQRAYLKDVGDKINPPVVAAGAAGRGGGGGGGRGGAAAPASNTGEIKAMLRGELTTLDSELAAAQKRATDVTTKRHLADARHQISDIVKPKGAASGSADASDDGLTRWPR
jgi:hypothetical protein